MSDDQWNILDTGVRSAEENMHLDAELLNGLEPNDLPILHFYDWEGDSATYGHFVKPGAFLNMDAARDMGLHLAKRPTGGGIVFHLWDLAFSVLIPSSHPHFSKNTLETYAFVNNAVLAAVSEFLANRPQLALIPQDAKALDQSCARFCMARPTKYDVVLQGKKIAGAAQRKTKKGFLHQGTIALKMPPEDYLRSILLPETKVAEAMLSHTFPLIEEHDDLNDAREALKTHLQKHLTMEHAYVTKS